jgi:hypothetical protein
MVHVSIKRNQAPGLLIRSGLKAGGRIVCYEEVNGSLYPVITPCSTDYYNPPTPVPPAPPDVQRVLCQACNGTQTPEGNLQNAKCEVCYL